MLTAVVIPVHSITVTSLPNQQQLTINACMGENGIPHTLMGTDNGNSDLDDATYAKYSARYVPIDTTWQVLYTKTCVKAVATDVNSFLVSSSISRRFNFH
jgi:hypothetical protein